MNGYFKYLLGRLPKLFLVCPLFFIQSNQLPVDNLTILEKLASSMVNKVIDQLSPDSTASLSVQSKGQNQEGNWLIENMFAKNLIRRGVSDLYINQQNIDTDLVIEFNLLDLGVRYSSIQKNKLVQRNFKVGLSIRALDGSSGLVKFVDELHDQYADSVEVKNIKNLENRDFSFTQASVPQKEGFKKYIEPLIVITTTAGVVYLFYRLRSN